MANRFRGEVQVTLDGVAYTLRMDMNVLAAFETETGQNALDWAGRAETGDVSTGDMIKMIHCALGRYHPDAEMLVAGDILSEDTGVLMRLLEASSPEPQKTKNPRKPPVKK